MTPTNDSNSRHRDGGMLKRRHFLKGAAAASALATAGCGLPYGFEQVVEKCPEPKANDPLRVDVHCHIMNLQDADREAFVHRHVSQQWWSEIPLAEEIVDLVIRIVQAPAVAYTSEARAERQLLRDHLSAMSNDFDKFCKTAAEQQRGLLFATETNQVTGFLSNRARNAARLMAVFPDVDLFTPSIVDFSEGDPGEYSSVVEQAMLYSLFAIATKGRILPMISFHPERSYMRDGKGDTMLLQQDLSIIELAVTRFGVIGVKVHPSTGFSPDYNKSFSCQESKRIARFKDVDEFHDHVDTAMGELFKLCRRLDIPVLTHNSKGLSSNIGCSEELENNRPDRWLLALKKSNGYKLPAARAAKRLDRRIQPLIQAPPLSEEDTGYQGAGKPDIFDRELVDSETGGPAANLRVCLGHFADGFKKPGNDGNVVPIDWLKLVLEEFEKTGDGRSPVTGDIFLDLSYMNEWFDRTDEKGAVDPRYKTAFASLLRDYPGFAEQVLYGSDWHMPPIAAMGDRYRSELENAIPDDKRADIMGRNAVKFLGLKDGNNLKRVTRFMKRNGVNMDDIHWYKKIRRDSTETQPTA